MKIPKFIIISQPRTGSNNISYMLNAHPQLDIGNELLHPVNGIPYSEAAAREGHPLKVVESNHIAQHWVTQFSPETLNFIMDQIFKENNGFKIHTQHISRFLFEHLFAQPDIKFIVTMRLSKFSQAISNFLASKRNIWQAGDRTAGKEIAIEPFAIPENLFISWIQNIHDDIVWLNNSLKQFNAMFYAVEYELFYSGEENQKVERVNHLFSFLGLPKLGELPQDARQECYKQLRKFFHSKTQKVTSEDDVSSLILNLDKLQSAYDRWRSSVIL